MRYAAGIIEGMTCDYLVYEVRSPFKDHICVHNARLKNTRDFGHAPRGLICFKSCLRRQHGPLPFGEHAALDVDGEGVGSGIVGTLTQVLKLEHADCAVDNWLGSGYAVPYGTT